MDDGRDGQQRTDAIQEQTPDEHGPVTVMAQDPGCVAQRGDRVCTARVSQPRDSTAQMFQPRDEKAKVNGKADLLPKVGGLEA